MRLLNKFFSPSQLVPPELVRPVYITNVLSSLLSLLTLVLLLILYSLFGWISTSKYILGVAIVFFLIVFINRRFYNSGRLLCCLLPIWMTMFVTIYGKTVDDRQSYIIYFDSRYILLATVILPAAVFRFAERSKITFCFGCTFLFLVLFDPIHNWFGVGYYQRGFSAPSYYYINYIAVTSFFVILFGIIVLKSISEKAEAVLQQVVQDKESINNQLISQNQRLTNLNY